ncbi:mediator of RNA polymerase II transcription subunit 4 [Lentithecium fluviatile CBS 122367]|uniref:Mediator of RNA polymerase II transcription subunit 4 n=1 Tax=Lentithecium fluviatile CBS 122367 TaxID=1168545 RepID=A0A6G1JBK9_9PLEO|nr:mediator of RNA polymerase II transcription subunit 4 [Lentithecium fluviatile CBS 122367]
MDDTLNAQFQRIETALSTLVDSIAAYNPSPQAAVELIAADDELSRGLDQLTQHQANHARIQVLRAEADGLEQQLKSSVAALASLRRELFETPATTFSEDSRPVPFDELLQYAKNISKYTVPPTYRERIPTPPAADQDKEGEGASGTASNGINTPAQGQSGGNVSGEGDAGVAKDITAEEAEWLKKLNESQVPWQPWPDNDKIRRSNLMQIQYLLDTKQDPTQVDATKMDREEKEMIVAEAERQAAAQAPVEVQIQHVSAPASETTSRPPEPKFGGFDFSEMDEDE